MKTTKLAATLSGAVMLAAGLGATTAATAAPASARLDRTRFGGHPA